MQDLGGSSREEATGLLMTALNETTLNNNQTTDAEKEVEADNALLERAKDGGPSINFSFPIMPSTEEEWKSWEGETSLIMS
jgi:hypothetical protein